MTLRARMTRLLYRRTDDAPIHSSCQHELFFFFNKQRQHGNHKRNRMSISIPAMHLPGGRAGWMHHLPYWADAGPTTPVGLHRSSADHGNEGLVPGSRVLIGVTARARI